MPHAHREWLDKNLFDSSKSRFPDTVVTFQDLDYSLATLLTDDDNLNLLVESLCVYARLKSKTMPGTLARQIALNENDIEDDVIEDKALAEVRELYSESLDTFAAFAEEEDEPVADGLFSAVTATVDRLYDCEDTDFCLAQLEDLALLDDTGTLEDYYDKIKSIEYRFIGRGVKIPLEERVGFQRVPSERFKAFLLQREKGSGLDIGQ